MTVSPTPHPSLSFCRGHQSLKLPSGSQRAASLRATGPEDLCPFCLVPELVSSAWATLRKTSWSGALGLPGKEVTNLSC